ncbi:MAG: GntR family transcriptional regulator [Desulfobacterales bacterium]|nr:GntR family transcriptional regulator [Desulfobacterales bacterium]
MRSRKRKETEKTDLTGKAYHAIRRMLFYNEIQPGQKIKYKDLASRIGVSMTPVIQALKWLEFSNIVRHEANRGYYINEVSLKEVMEVYNTRLLIEVALVPDIMKNLNPEGLDRLETAMENHKQAVAEDNYYKRILTDREYHLCLSSLADSQIQLKLLEGLFDVLLLRYSRNLYFSSVMDTSLKEHIDILDCLKKRDQKRLEDALAYHITVVRDHIIKGMSQLMAGQGDTFSDAYFS